MNGDIKFKVWDKARKVMHYQADGDVIFCFDGIGVSVYLTDGTEISDYELMQYTGVNDCHGKEIYDRDIVQFFNDTDYIITPGYAKVIFENGAFCLKHFKYGVENLNNIDIDDMNVSVVGTKIGKEYDE